MIRGIGPVYAKRMVQLFGTDVFDIIEASPGRLREVAGIGPTRAARITAAWADQKMIREIMVFLYQHGVGTARAVRIFKTYGADAVQVMSENPYRLARDIRGIGFRTADLIAERLGIEKTAMIRVRAGISFALTEAMGDGHCGLPAAELTTLAVKLLAVPEELIASALEQELAEQTVTADSVAGTPCVFLSGLYHAEQSVAGHLRRVTGGPVPWPAIDAAKALPWAEARTGLTLADSQAAAVRLALRSKATVITGGPGVGKTTIVKTILRILQAKAVTLLLWCARQTGEGWPVKVRRKEGVTNHLHPESCAGRCEAAGEALTGARTGRAIEHRKRGGLERRDYHSGRRPHRHHRAG